MTTVREFAGRLVGVVSASLVAAAFFGASMPKAARLRLTLPEHEARVVEFSPDGRLILTDGDSGGCVRDAVTGRVLVGLTRAGSGGASRATDITFPRFTPDGRHVVVQLGGPRFAADPTVTLAVFEVATGRQCASFTVIGTETWPASAYPAAEYALSADGSTLAFGRSPDLGTGRVKVWDVAAHRVAADFPVAPPFTLTQEGGATVITADFPGFPPFALSPDGGMIAYPEPSSDAPSLAILTLNSGRTATIRIDRSRESPGRRIGAMAFSPDGKLLAATMSGIWGGVKVLDVSSGRVRAALPPKLPRPLGWFHPNGAWFSTDAKTLFLEDLGGVGDRPEVQARDISVAPPRLVLRGPSESFTPDGSRAAVAEWNVASRWIRGASDDTKLDVVDLRSPRVPLRLVETGVHRATISPNGRVMALPSDRSEIIESNAVVALVRPILQRLGVWRFGIGDLNPPVKDVHEIRLRDAVTGRLVGLIDRSARPRTPSEVSFSPDGEVLIVKYLPERFPGWDSRNPMIDWSVDLWEVPTDKPRGGSSAPTAALAAASLVLVGAWIDRRRRLRGARPNPG